MKNHPGVVARLGYSAGVWQLRYPAHRTAGNVALIGQSDSNSDRGDMNPIMRGGTDYEH
jgi:hypothetical protein